MPTEPLHPRPDAPRHRASVGPSCGLRRVARPPGGQGRPGSGSGPTREPVHGDLSTNLAMQLARPLRMSPLVIANALATELNRESADSPDRHRWRRRRRATRLRQPATRRRALETVVGDVLADPGRWGRSRPPPMRERQRRVRLGQPDRPLHVGNARGAFVGDLLCRVLEAGGQRVTREYYSTTQAARSASSARPSPPSSRRAAPTRATRATT